MDLRRMRWFNRFTVAALLLALAGTPVYAGDRGPERKASAEGMIVDLIVLRPAGVVALGIGSVVFVASFPFSLLGGNVRQSARKLVGEPARFTFARPLGQVGYPGDDPNR
jgi:hypothetical protein